MVITVWAHFRTHIVRSVGLDFARKHWKIVLWWLLQSISCVAASNNSNTNCLMKRMSMRQSHGWFGGGALILPKRTARVDCTSAASASATMCSRITVYVRKGWITLPLMHFCVYLFIHPHTKGLKPILTMNAFLQLERERIPWCLCGMCAMCANVFKLQSD